MEYRVYLLTRADRVRAAEDFVAADDAEATEIAAALQEVTADVFGGCEVWRGTKHVATLYLKPSQHPRAVKIPSASSLDARLIASPVRQERFVQLEEQLLNSFECVKERRRLLETLRRHEKLTSLKQQMHDALAQEQQSDASAGAKESN